MNTCYIFRHHGYVSFWKIYIKFRNFRKKKLMSLINLHERLSFELPSWTTMYSGHLRATAWGQAGCWVCTAYVQKSGFMRLDHLSTCKQQWFCHVPWPKCWLLGLHSLHVNRMHLDYLSTCKLQLFCLPRSKYELNRVAGTWFIGKPSVRRSSIRDLNRARKKICSLVAISLQASRWIAKSLNNLHYLYKPNFK